MRTLLLTLTTCLFVVPAYAKYSGGTGEPNDPYQIATAEDLMLLGETPEDYDKHFILTADIDLDPNLPGGRVFDRAVIAPDTNDMADGFQGIAFTGVFDGNGHRISNLMITGKDYVGLFGRADYGARILNLGLAAVDASGTDHVGGLVGDIWCEVTNCYSTGSVNGQKYVGGLVGGNGNPGGFVADCYSTCAVIGKTEVGGVVGENGGPVTQCYSNGAVSGTDSVGGLVGLNAGGIERSYSTGPVSGTGWAIGGLVGRNWSGHVGQCFSTSVVTGAEYVGGLVGFSDFRFERMPCFWDVQTSGQTWSAGGAGKITAQMQTAKTFLDAGWDFVDETENGTDDIWKIAEGLGYPRLAWEKYSGGTGEPNDPYQIAAAADLIALGETPDDYDKHFLLTADIDLDPNIPGRKVFDKAVIAPDTDPTNYLWQFDGTPFTGVLDGNGHTISHLTMMGTSYLGLFGQVGGSHPEVKNLAVVDVRIIGSGHSVGGLVGYKFCGTVTGCFSTGRVSGNSDVGGLVGVNGWTIYQGGCDPVVTHCYSTAAVSGGDNVGGLVGTNARGYVRQCYGSGAVTGTGQNVGGLVGHFHGGDVADSLWDIQTSGQSWSDGGTGKTTAEMQTAKTFLDAGWDFVGETENGPNDVWKIVEGQTYPLLSWQKYSGGTGEPNDPYQIATAADLIALGETPEDYDKHFILTADIDLDPNLPGGMVFDRAVIAPDTNDMADGFQGIAFTGVFDGNSHTISNLTVIGPGLLGLFGELKGEVKNLGVVDVKVSGSGDYVGGLVGSNFGTLTDSYTIGAVRGTGRCGGLVGSNGQSVTQCYSSGTVSGMDDVGGLVGTSNGTVARCYSSGLVNGTGQNAGGLLGWNRGGYVTKCHSTAVVNGKDYVGGLLGSHGTAGPRGGVDQCYSAGTVSGTGSGVGGLVGRAILFPPLISRYATNSFWDTQTSGQATSAGGTGKTTAEMQTAKTFLDAGWDFVGETANGTEDIWWINEGKDYPRLWWEPRN